MRESHDVAMAQAISLIAQAQSILDVLSHELKTEEPPEAQEQLVGLPTPSEMVSEVAGFLEFGLDCLEDIRSMKGWTKCTDYCTMEVHGGDLGEDSRQGG